MRRAAVPLAAGLLVLAGCATSGGDPVAWWHQMQGGRIAEARPEPPRADAPYPSLATVPARPTVDDAAVRGRIASGLVADRANAAYAAGTRLPPLPITAPPPRAPLPAPGAAMSAALDASSTPTPPPAAPPPATAPRGAPVGKVAATPLATPVVADAPIPVIPDRPPAPPSLPGVAKATAPAPAPVVPPVAVVSAGLPPGAPVAVAFAAGSATLEGPARAQLAALAARRGTAGIAVAGFGDAGSSDPSEQSAVMTLAWARAQAIATALQAAGVPVAALRVSAAASGRGGIAAIAE